MNFKNTDKNAIIINNVSDITLEDNNIMSVSQMKDIFGISLNLSNNTELIDNDVYITGENTLIQGILLNNSDNLTFVKKIV